jgi:molybdopterin/thiamine biosynthesis adenylyltransferase
MIERFPIFRVPPHQQGQRWSRTQGGFGGREVWERWLGCPMAIIGVGRSGSLLAEALIRSGVLNLSLIDADIVEPHNLAEMALADETDVGQPKAEAIAQRLLNLNANAHIHAFLQRIGEAKTRQVAARHPILWQCVDNDAARIQGGLVATAYHRVLIDVATGIHTVNQRRMGADIRLILPGDGCLLCRGGLSQGWKGLFPEVSQTRDWREQRAGSLRSLNQIAIGLALRLAEDLFAERLTRSIWLHLEFSADGMAQITYPPLEASGECLLCKKAGSGDALFEWPN